MLMTFLYFLSIIGYIFIPCLSSDPTTLVPHMKFVNPAFLSFINLTDPLSSTKNQLLVTTFGTKQNFISVVSDMNIIYSSEAIEVSTDSKVVGNNNEYVWPNIAEIIPNNVFTEKERSLFCKDVALSNCTLLIIPDGFLVPGHKTGGVHIQGVDTSLSSSSSSVLQSVNIAGQDKDYFYHKANWFDVNNDGLLDVLIARCKVNTFGKASGELVWLQHPSSLSSLTDVWTMQVLVDGPDVITLPIVGRDGLLYILSAEFFNERLSLTSLSIGSDPKIMSYVVVDSDTGPADDLKMGDVDGDGVLELLLTSHANQNGMVYAYELPSNLLPPNEISQSDNFSRVTIGSGFITTIPGPNQASPGFIYPVSYLDKKRNMTSESHSNRSYFVISGDGSESMHLLTPIDDVSNPYSYAMETIFVTKGTVGSLAVGDINSDGVCDVVVPDYDNGILYFYSFKDYIPTL